MGGAAGLLLLLCWVWGGGERGAAKGRGRRSRLFFFFCSPGGFVWERENGVSAAGAGTGAQTRAGSLALSVVVATRRARMGARKDGGRGVARGRRAEKRKKGASQKKKGRRIRRPPFGWVSALSSFRGSPAAAARLLPPEPRAHTRAHTQRGQEGGEKGAGEGAKGGLVVLKGVLF